MVAGLLGPAEAFEVEAVAAIELDAFLFEQALLCGIAAVAGQCVGDLAPGVDDAVPGDVDGGIEVLEDLADEAGAAGQAGEGGNLAVGGDPALGDAADDGADGGDGGVTEGWGGSGEGSVGGQRDGSFRGWESVVCLAGRGGGLV